MNSANPKNFYTLYGSQYISQKRAGEFGIINIKISTDSKVKNNILKNRFLSNNLLMPSVDGNIIKKRSLLNLGKINWNELFDSKTNYNLEVETIPWGTDIGEDSNISVPYVYDDSQNNLNNALKSIYNPFTKWAMEYYSKVQKIVISETNLAKMTWIV